MYYIGETKAVSLLLKITHFYSLSNFNSFTKRFYLDGSRWKTTKILWDFIPHHGILCAHHRTP